MRRSIPPYSVHRLIACCSFLLLQTVSFADTAQRPLVVVLEPSEHIDIRQSAPKQLKRSFDLVQMQMVPERAFKTGIPRLFLAVTLAVDDSPDGFLGDAVKASAVATLHNSAGVVVLRNASFVHWGRGETPTLANENALAGLFEQVAISVAKQLGYLADRSSSAVYGLTVVRISGLRRYFQVRELCTLLRQQINAVSECRPEFLSEGDIWLRVTSDAHSALVVQTLARHDWPNFSLRVRPTTSGPAWLEVVSVN